MDYQVILSAGLSITPDAVIIAWNADPSCRDTVLAARLDAPPAGYPIDPDTILVFLGGAATTLATGVIINLISDLLKRKCCSTAWPPSSMGTVVIEPASSTRLLGVKPPA
jgi:hypothetical protein